MYNRKNWRDVDKAKSQTRQEAATAEEIQQQEAYDAYQVTKAMNLLRKIQVDSEVRDQYANGRCYTGSSHLPQISVPRDCALLRKPHQTDRHTALHKSPSKQSHAGNQQGLSAGMPVG